MHQIRHKRYFLPALKIKDCNVKFDGQNFFDQPVKNDIWKIAAGQGDDYTTGYLID